MKKIKSIKDKAFSKFLSKLAKELTNFYNTKLNKKFKIENKLRGKGYDPVTTADKAFEKFIRSKITKKFPNHEIIGVPSAAQAFGGGGLGCITQQLPISNRK